MSASSWVMTIAEVADALAVSTDTVRRLIERGQLPKVLIGRSVRIPTAAVEDYVSTNTITAAPVSRTRTQPPAVHRHPRRGTDMPRVSAAAFLASQRNGGSIP